MKTLKDYIVESETWMQTPAEGDTFGIELSDGTLIESYILELADVLGFWFELAPSQKACTSTECF